MTKKSIITDSLSSPNSILAQENGEKALNATHEDYIQADLYVRMANTSTNRVLWAISATLIIIITTFVMGFNQYWSYGHINSKELFANGIKLKKELKLASDYLDSTKTTYNGISKDTIEYLKDENNYAKIARREYIRNYEDSYYVIIPLLGSKINSDDAPFLFGLTLLILFFWVYVCVKNENFTIGKIFDLTLKKPINIKKYIFYGISFYNHTIPNTQRLSLYCELTEKKRNLKEELFVYREKRKSGSYINRMMQKLVKLSVQNIIFIGSTIFLFYCIWDLLVLLEWDYTKGFVEYETDLSIMGIINNYSATHTYWIIQLVAAFLLILLMFYMSRLIHKTQNATKEIMNDYRRRFKHDECCKNCITQLNNKKYELILDSIKEEDILSKKDNNILTEFIEKYNENDYLLLCQTGTVKEVERLISQLTENKSFEKDVQILYKKTNVEKGNGYEYFLFLRESKTMTFNKRTEI